MSIKIKNLKVKDVMLDPDKFPVLNKNSILKEALDLMCRNKFGAVCVVNENKKIIGILTDGDIRRKLLKSQKPLSALMIEDVIKICSKKPQTIKSKTSLINAVKLMKKRKIWDLPVTDNKKNLLGVLHLHDALNCII